MDISLIQDYENIGQFVLFNVFISQEKVDDVYTDEKLNNKELFEKIIKLRLEIKEFLDE